MWIERFIVNVEGAIFKGEKWLLVKRSEREIHATGDVSLVGGQVEGIIFSDDILKSTLRREIKEEVGIEVKEQMYYITSSFFKATMGEPVIDIIFLCEYKQGEATPLDTNEVTTAEWLDMAGINLNGSIKPWTKRFLKLAEETRNKIQKQS